MKKISLQWRLTILTTVLITVLCGCLTFFLYKNGVYYIDTLQETVTDQSAAPEAVYIDIPDNEWDDFAAQFATKVYNSKSDYRNRSLLITVVVALIGGAVTFFVSGRALKPLKEFSETVEKVQAQNLADYTIEENRIAELDRLRTSYNKMLLRLSESFETQRLLCEAFAYIWSGARSHISAIWRRIFCSRPCIFFPMRTGERSQCLM